MEQSVMRQKLDEAEYFRRGMDRVANCPTSFRHELSAFLSAARTVMQYLTKECEKEGCLRWYEDKMDDQMFKFFRCLRNMNIHDHPIRPREDVTLKQNERLGVSDELLIKRTDKNGNPSQAEKVAGTRSRAQEPTESERTVKYSFVDWPCDQKDVQKLCDKYFGALKAVLDDWDRKQGNPTCGGAV